MGFSTLTAFFSILPKRLLFVLLLIFTVIFLVYFKGVSDGREPYRQAMQELDAKEKIITKQTKANRIVIKQKGTRANVEADKFTCSIDGATADWLSDIKP